MMVAVSSGGVDASTARAIDDSRAGSVLLLGNTTAGRARVLAVTEQARDAARTPEDIETMLAADQEGGQVQRLQGPGLRPHPLGAAAGARTQQPSWRPTPPVGGSS